MATLSELMKEQIAAIQKASQASYQAGYEAGFRAGCEASRKIIQQGINALASSEKAPASGAERQTSL